MTGARRKPPQDTTPKNIRLEMSINDGNTLRYADLPASSDQLRTLAKGVLEGSTLSEAAWTPGLFTRGEFSQLKAALIRRGLAVNRSRDPARGIQLTRPGEAAFQWLAGLGDPPTTTPSLTRRL